METKEEYKKFEIFYLYRKSVQNYALCLRFLVIAQGI